MVGETQVLEEDRGRTADAGTGLREAIGRLECELTAYRRQLPDRAVAEDELRELARLAADTDRVLERPDTENLRHSLLLVTGALGSVSALRAPLDALREAVERLAPTPFPRPYR
ncbi:MULTISPECIES: DUF5955 family protein [unclassified Streptomyces]|uniref:DUF5955 family protein n=1 Tax=unclassified Streptomyces TaxID=2593676 RepID=UPI002E2E0912|nr:DUF5955 family protein [Streptomyces sp. NBC_00223]